MVTYYLNGAEKIEKGKVYLVFAATNDINSNKYGFTAVSKESSFEIVEDDNLIKNLSSKNYKKVLIKNSNLTLEDILK